MKSLAAIALTATVLATSVLAGSVEVKAAKFNGFDDAYNNSFATFKVECAEKKTDYDITFKYLPGGEDMREETIIPANNAILVQNLIKNPDMLKTVCVELDGIKTDVEVLGVCGAVNKNEWDATIHNDDIYNSDVVYLGYEVRDDEIVLKLAKVCSEDEISSDDDSSNGAPARVTSVTAKKHYTVGDKMEAKDFEVEVTNKDGKKETIDTKYIGLGTSILQEKGVISSDNVWKKAGEHEVYIRADVPDSNIIGLGVKLKVEDKEEKKEDKKEEKEEEKEEKKEESSSSNNNPAPALTPEQQAKVTEQAQAVVGSKAYTEKQAEVQKTVAASIAQLAALTPAQKAAVASTGVAVNLGGCTTLDRTTVVNMASNNTIPYNMVFTWNGAVFSVKVPAGVDYLSLIDANGNLQMWKLVQKFGIASAKLAK